MLSWAPLPAVGVLVALVVAGCGSDNKKADRSSAASPAPAAVSKAKGQVVKLSADPGGALKFTQTKLTAKAGNVTLEMANPSQLGHGVAVEGHGVDKDGAVIGSGQTSTVTADLKPGTYEFYCPVSSHKKAGMKGTLVVK